MPLKGLVRIFTILLILISLYQLSFTLFVGNAEKKAMAQAKRQAAATGVTGTALKQLVAQRYDRITDSLNGETVANFGLAKFTYAEAKEQELNLGLDLQGGMNVTLEVSLDDLVRSLATNPRDPRITGAIAAANARKVESQADFVTLFGEELRRLTNGQKLAYLFTKPSSTSEITTASTDEQVLSYIRREATDAIQLTYKVLQTRIDKFGVAQPSINLEPRRGIITVELAGVRDPVRVRSFLQSTANLQFFETYTNQDILNDNAYGGANEALAAYLSGTTTPAVRDTARTTNDTGRNGQTAGIDTNGADSGTNLAEALGGGAPTAAGDTGDKAKFPLRDVWILREDLLQGKTPMVGFVMKKDTAKLRRYLEIDAVRSKFPANVKFVYGAESGEARRRADAPLTLYALRPAPGGGARLDGEHVTNATRDFDPVSGEPEVSMSMDMTGARIWQKLTGENVGNHVAVVLDDRVYSAPVIQGEIPGGRTSISGSFTLEEATDLANILKSGKLQAPARIVQEQVVGPTLGKENILAGKNSLLIAFAVIFLLMLVYYNTAGIVANIALILNLLFTIGILAAWGATLTMPGIAGLVLTIGMAVDTNVIVFERIKEELSGGKGYEQAVSDGYRRSYAPVLDGHITQFLTALILFVFGLGPVKGFATTQMLGLALSVFCGLLVSRLITDMWMKRGRHFKYFTGLSKRLFRRANFKFIQFRKVTYVISFIVLALGIASVINGYDYGVEFAGGRSYTVRFDKPLRTDAVRSALTAAFGNVAPVVKTIGTDNKLNITTAYLIGRTDSASSLQVEQELYNGLSKAGYLPAGLTFGAFSSGNRYVENRQTVQPTISDDLKKGALWATGLSLAAIFLYILLRFRKWQYSLGTIVALLHDVCITLAVFSFLRGRVPFALEIDQHFIAAILTVIGFSMNDTVIVFDRVREYFRKSPGEDKKSVINRAINDTLSRTVMTSLTVFLTVLILFIFGGEVTKGFAFAMLIGVITGTYSSIFVAAPILVDMDRGNSLQSEADHATRIEELKKLA